MPRKIQQINIKFSPELPARAITPRELKTELTARQLGKAGLIRGNRANIELKEKIINRLWQTNHKIKMPMKHSEERKLIEAMADNLSGEALKDSALKYGIAPERLATYRARFFRADSALAQFLEEIMLAGSIRCVGIFNDKANELTAFQAATIAGIFADKAVALRKARTTDYTEESVPLATLQKIGDIMERIGNAKPGKVIEAQVEVKRLTERSESDATSQDS